MRRCAIITLCLVLLAVSGCSFRKISQKQARGLCLSRSFESDKVNLAGCADKALVCDSFFTGGALENLSREECFAHCDQVRKDLGLPFMTNGCWSTVRHAWGLCDTLCRGKKE